MEAPVAFQLKGVLSGHDGWVTRIATSAKNPNQIVSCSRDKSLMIWKIADGDGGDFSTEWSGSPYKRLMAHDHFLSDVILSNDGNYALTGSWDKTLRLWDLQRCVPTRRFSGHTKDVLSVAFSHDNRQIISGSRDRTIRLWNTIAECKYVIQDDCHTDWVSCVRFSPKKVDPVIVSCGWDHNVKIWNLSNCKLSHTHSSHTGYLNTVAISPDGSLCASGGKDFLANLWDLNDNKLLYTLDHSHEINSLVFSPNRFWLCVANGPNIKIWDLEFKRELGDLCVDSRPGSKTSVLPTCLCMCWSADGNTFYAGYTDNKIRVWSVSKDV